jgi:hypothetical protein
MSDETNWLRDLQDIEELCGGDVDLYINESRRASYVTKYYGGDLQRYARGTNKGRRESISWKIMKLYGECDPKDLAFIRKVACWRLGFDAHENAMIPASIHLCDLLKEFHPDASMNWDGFTQRFDAQLKLVRNEHLQCNGWVDHLELTDADYRHYESYMPHLKQEARQLLAQFLGYTPELKYSLFAELTIRKCLDGQGWAGMNSFLQSELRCHSLTIVKYLEALHQHGRAFADQSSLHGFDWNNDFKPKILN